MVKKKKTTIDYLAGYVPASYTPVVVSKTLTQIPSYPDRGIEFKGKFKEQIGNYDYKINNQKILCASDFFNFDAGSGGIIVGITEAEGTNWFIKSIKIEAIVAVADALYLKQKGTGTVMATFLLPIGYSQHDLFLDIPINLNNGGFFLDFATTTSTLHDKLAWNFFGWTEKT